MTRKGEIGCSYEALCLLIWNDKDRQKSFCSVNEKGELSFCPRSALPNCHPQARVLVNTGIHAEVFEAPASRWGGFAKAVFPEGGRKEGVLEKSYTIGMRASDIDNVVNTHLHADHAGGNQMFAHALFTYRDRSLWRLELPRTTERDITAGIAITD